MLRKFTAFVPRYRKFESISLQQTVRLSPRSHFRASRTRAFPAGVRGSLDDGVSRDAAGFPLRASAADAVSGTATTVRTKSGVSGL